MSLETLSELFTAPAPEPQPEPDHLRAQFNSEEWHWLHGHPDTLAAYRLAFETRQQREAGIIPPTYTGATVCKGCGPVTIWHGAPAYVLGCPWCINRLQGRPIPDLHQGRLNEAAPASARPALGPAKRNPS